MSHVQISRDPFARTTLVRQRVYVGYPGMPAGCSWCGQTRTSHQGVLSLFEYGTERDDNGRVNWHKGLFCSKGCHDAYHG